MLHPNFKYFGELFSQWIPMNNFSEISTNISFLSRGIEEIASISLYVDSEIPSMAGIISLEPSTINSLVCSSHGTCVSKYSCSCSSGYTGSQCEIVICYSISQGDPLICSSKGSCINVDICLCRYGYTGNQF